MWKKHHLLDTRSQGDRRRRTRTHVPWVIGEDVHVYAIRGYAHLHRVLVEYVRFQIGKGWRSITAQQILHNLRHSSKGCRKLSPSNIFFFFQPFEDNSRKDQDCLAEERTIENARVWKLYLNINNSMLLSPGCNEEQTSKMWCFFHQLYEKMLYKKCPAEATSLKICENCFLLFFNNGPAGRGLPDVGAPRNALQKCFFFLQRPPEVSDRKGRKNKDHRKNTTSPVTRKL